MKTTSLSNLRQPDRHDFDSRPRDGQRLAVTSDNSSRDPCPVAGGGSVLLGFTYFSGSSDQGREIRVAVGTPISAESSASGETELSFATPETLAEYRDYESAVNFAALGASDSEAYATWEVGQVAPDAYRWLDGMVGSGAPPSWTAGDGNWTGVDQTTDSAQYATVVVYGTATHLFWVEGFAGVDPTNPEDATLRNPVLRYRTRS